MIQPAFFDECFGIEDFAAILTYHGSIPEARNLLNRICGTLTPEDERGRFLSSTHSLYARSFLSTVDGKFALSSKLSELIESIANSKQVFRISKTGKFGEDLLLCYFQENSIVEQYITNVVAYRFCFPIGKSNVPLDVFDYFNPIFNVDQSKCVNMPTTFLFDFPNIDRTDVNQLFEYISRISNEQSQSQLLAEDLAENLWRGSMIWMESDTMESLSLRGALLVQGKARLWKIQTLENQMLRAETVGKDQFISLIDSLIG